MRNTHLILMIAALLALSGCKKDDTTEAPEDAAAPTGMLGAATDKAKAHAAAAVPQPDANKPLASYRELDTDSTDAMFLYQAVSNMPPDFEKLAAKYSKEYQETSDSFRKQELLTALKPQMEQMIAQAKSSPYASITLKYSNNLEAYDFQRKGFPVFAFGENVRQEVLGEYPNTNSLTWINRGQVAFAPVANESAAREIENLRTRHQYDKPPLVKVYFFAQSANLNSDEINAVVTRVQITDKSGRVLADYGPDGSFPQQALGSAQSEAEAACATGDAAACDAAQAAVDAAAN